MDKIGQKETTHNVVNLIILRQKTSILVVRSWLRAKQTFLNLNFSELRHWILWIGARSCLCFLYHFFFFYIFTTFFPRFKLYGLNWTWKACNKNTLHAPHRSISLSHYLKGLRQGKLSAICYVTQGQGSLAIMMVFPRVTSETGLWFSVEWPHVAGSMASTHWYLDPSREKHRSHRMGRILAIVIIFGNFFYKHC